MIHQPSWRQQHCRSLPHQEQKHAPQLAATMHAKASTTARVPWHTSFSVSPGVRESAHAHGVRKRPPANVEANPPLAGNICNYDQHRRSRRDGDALRKLTHKRSYNVIAVCKVSAGYHLQRPSEDFRKGQACAPAVHATRLRHPPATAAAKRAFAMSQLLAWRPGTHDERSTFLTRD